ncbi:MAG: hypothetical protein N2C12_06580, partial [Planctomycetales bacterium]
MNRTLYLCACAFFLFATLVWQVTAEDPDAGFEVVPGGIKPAEDAPKPMSPEASKAKIQLPEGLRIDLVANEPLVEDPTGITFDEQGRLFVCAIHGYNREGHVDVMELNKTGRLDKRIWRYRIEGKKLAAAMRQQTGSLRMLVDKDADGIMDDAIVWADDLAPAYGVIAARGGVIVVASPEITYFADTDGDGKPDIREVLFKGFGRTLLERGNNCPRMGPDGWIYVGAGGEGGDITGPHLKKMVRLGHSDFRFKPDGTAIERVTGSVGTFGLAVNDIGDRFPCTGGQPGIYSLPIAQRYLVRNPNVPAPSSNHASVSHNKDYNKVYRLSVPHPWRVKRNLDPKWRKFYGSHETNSSYYTAGCGGEFYYGDLLPEDFEGNFFLCEPSQNIINRTIMNRNGSGYKGHRAPGDEKKEFVASSDQWFRPINLSVGPDGALYVCDMYREIIEDYSAVPRFLQQQYGLTEGDQWGRIWRIAPSDSDPYSTMNLVGMKPDQWVALLDSPNVWRRNTAQRLLIENNEKSAAGALFELVKTGTSPVGRMLALRTLDGIGELKPAEVLYALGDKDYRVRVHALQLSEPWLNSDEQLLAKVTSMTEDVDPRVRLQLALTLGESKYPSAQDALLKMARNSGQQRWMSAAILSSASETADALLARLLQDDIASEGAKVVMAPLAVTVGARRNADEISRSLTSIADAKDSVVQARCLDGLIQGLQGGEAASASNGNRDALTELLASPSTEVRSKAIRLAPRVGLG